MKVPDYLVLGEGSLPVLQMAIFLWPHTGIELISLPLLTRILIPWCGSGDSILSISSNLITSQRAHLQILSHWGVEPTTYEFRGKVSVLNNLLHGLSISIPTISVWLFLMFNLLSNTRYLQGFCLFLSIY